MNTAETERGIFVRFAESDPQATASRDTWVEAHKTYLRQDFGAQVRILLSGPFQSGDEGGRAALIIAEASSLAAFTAFSEQDPFVAHRVYDRVRILRWTPTLVGVAGFPSC